MNDKIAFPNSQKYIYIISADTIILRDLLFRASNFRHEKANVHVKDTVNGRNIQYYFFLME